MFKKKNNNSLKTGTDKKKFSPSIFAILISLTLVVIVASWIVYWANGSDPQGQVHPAGFLEILSAPVKGFINASEVIIFLLCLSAFLYIVNRTKALDAGIGKLFVKLQGKEIMLLIILMVVFAICGTTFGMCEATIPFYFMLLPILYAAGFDSFLALIVICFGAGTGVLASTINPILVANAVDAANQGIAAAGGDVVIGTMDGIVWRVLSLVIILSFVIGYAIWYARRLKKDITKSFVYASISTHSKEFTFDKDVIPPLTTRRKAVLGVFITTFIILIVFAVPWDTIAGVSIFDMIGSQLATWFPYIAGQSIDPITGQIIGNIDPIGTWAIYEMAFLFFSASIIAYSINWKSEKELSSEFIKGASEFVSVAFVIALATGFSVILTETGIANLLINIINGMATGMNSILFVLVLFIIFLAIAFFIPSMSGFSRAVFPVIGPALVISGSSVGVSGAVLVFSFASGIINMIAPTAIAFVVGCQICGISLSTFYKKGFVLYGGVIGLCMLMLILGTVINMFAPAAAIF